MWQKLEYSFNNFILWPGWLKHFWPDANNDQNNRTDSVDEDGCDGDECVLTYACCHSWTTGCWEMGLPLQHRWRRASSLAGDDLKVQLSEGELDTEGKASARFIYTRIKKRINSFSYGKSFIDRRWRQNIQ